MKDGRQEVAGIEGLPCGICFVSMDDEEKVLYGNWAFLELTGVSSQEELLALSGGSFEGLTAEGHVPLRQRYEAEEKWTAGLCFYLLLKNRSEGTVPVKGTVGIYETSSHEKVWCVSCIRSRKDLLEEGGMASLMDRKSFYPAVTKVSAEDIKNHTLGSRAQVYFNLTNFKVYNSRHGMKAGDDLMQFMAHRLRFHFPHALIAHLTGDTFALLAPQQDVAKRIEALALDVDEYTHDSSIRLKAGVNLISPDADKADESSLHLLFDMAKIAADWIKGDAGRTWAVYEPYMGKHLSDKAFVLGNFEKALKKGYIKVYYQLMVRSFTGKVCGTEALARWEDPEKGLITPDIFVPVLEEAKLIHLLDTHVVEEVAKMYHFLLDNRRPYVPISVNLSAVDFEVMDPFSFVEEMVKQYQVPRNFFHIEITESALKKDETRLRHEIDRFRKAGYECWLDDFGSGYSSLNVLKSYRFDTLKLDMAFQRDLNEKGRKIISSIIFMAKELGIHTLAEGVETKEQAEFLKNIGCEKLQGWYYGKPLPYEESYRYCIDHHMGVETAAEASFYDKAGLANVVSDSPSGVFLFDGTDLAILFENEASRQVAKELHADYFMKDGKRMISMDLPTLQQFHQLIDASRKSGRKESMVYIFNGQYVHCSVKVLAVQDRLSTGKFEFYAVSSREERKAAPYMDKLLRHLFIIYDGLYVIQKKTGMVEVMESMNRVARNGEMVSMARFRKLSDFIHEEDRKRFYTFMNMSYLEREARKSQRSAVTGLFRLRMDNGSYRWKEFNFALMGPDQDGDILLGIKDTAVDEAAEGKKILSDYAASYGLITGGGNDRRWRNVAFASLMQSGSICFFWKDRERRFLGASSAFLEKFGLTLDDILGKTDDEIGWHVDGSLFRNEEVKVIRQGIVSRQALGRCLIRGKIHRIRATKFPLYEGNEIVGLAGYFFDMEDIGKVLRDNQELAVKDQETGLLNYRGMFMTGLAFHANYKTHGENYGAVLMDIPELDDIGKTYGPAVRRKLLTKLVRLLSRFFLHREAIAHLGSGRFLVMMKAENTSDIHQKLLELSNSVHEIHDIDGRSVTLFLQYALALGSEARTVDEFFHLLARRLTEAENEKYGESLYRSDRIVFDRQVFDNSSEQIMISDPDDYSLLYVNKAGLRDLGLPEDYDYTGKKCYELICAEKRPCDLCPLAYLRRDRFYTRTFHNRNTGQDYLIQHTLISWYGKTCHYESAVNLGSYAERDFKKKYLLFKEMAVNDAIEAGLSEGNPHDGIMKMLAKIGDILEAEKACIFESQKDGTFKNTYEWCSEGVASEQEHFQHVPAEMVRPIYDRFGPDQVAIVEDVDDVARSYGFSASTYRKGLKRLISGHLMIAGQSLGYTEIVNPSEKTMKEASPLLATLTRFLAIMIRNRNTVSRLQQLSHVDQLTGLMNRRSFMEYVHRLPEGKRVAFLFGDMNGLKRINDKKGHEAGDAALKTLASAMADLVGRDHAFRMGGDEFILAVDDADEKKAARVAEELKGKLRLKGLSMAIGTALRTAPLTDIDELITEMDKKMYEDKRHPRR